MTKQAPMAKTVEQNEQSARSCGYRKLTHQEHTNNCAVYGSLLFFDSGLHIPVYTLGILRQMWHPKATTPSPGLA